MLLRIVAACYAALRVFLTAGLLRRPKRAADQPFVSVVVAARDEAPQLPTLLSALLCQDYPAYEVIVVDDRSTDDTPAVLRYWHERDNRLRSVRIEDVPADRTPKMYALSKGVQAARGDLLLFTDADCSVPTTWVSAVAACFTRDVGAVIGYVELRADHATLFEYVQAFDYFAMMAMTASATTWGMPLGAAGANLAYRRAAYEEAGGFEAMPGGAVADDMLLIQRVHDQTNWRITFCDDVCGFISTAAEPTLSKFFVQRARWMAGGQEVLRDNVPLLVASSLIGTFNGILLSFPLLLRDPSTRRALPWAIGSRLLADMLHLGVAAIRFRRTDLLPYLPLWLVLQLPYTIILPLYSRVGTWAWKGRKPAAPSA